MRPKRNECADNQTTTAQGMVGSNKPYNQVEDLQGCIDHLEHKVADLKNEILILYRRLYGQDIANDY